MCVGFGRAHEKYRRGHTDLECIRKHGKYERHEKKK
jgi:hypothetical protein